MKKNMLKTAAALVFTVSATVSCSAQEQISLPQPSKSLETTVIEALQNRRSERVFAEKQMSDTSMGRQRNKPRGWPPHGSLGHKCPGHRHIRGTCRRRIPMGRKRKHAQACIRRRLAPARGQRPGLCVAGTRVARTRERQVAFRQQAGQLCTSRCRIRKPKHLPLLLGCRMGMLPARLDGHGGPEESAATERKPGTNAEQHRGLPQIKSAERPRH